MIKFITTLPISLPEAAIHYAKHGLNIFPLIPKSKVPIEVGGFKIATNKLKQIQEWWKETPDANIGLTTGAINHLIVLDIDGEYPEGWPKIDSNWYVKTPKGYHIYFEYLKDNPLRNRAGIVPNIDLRGDGGYIVAPPSIHPTGGRYEFIIS